MEKTPAGTVTVFECVKNGLTVVAVRDMINVDWYHKPIADQYRITTNTGYRSEFRACYDDRCLAETITSCRCDGQGSRSVVAWLAHSSTTCHGWHDVKAIAFAKKVLGSTNPDRELSVGAKSGYYQSKNFVPCAWPVEGLGRTVTFVDGRPRPDDYGYDVNIPIIVSDTEITS